MTKKWDGLLHSVHEQPQPVHHLLPVVLPELPLPILDVALQVGHSRVATVVSQGDTRPTFNQSLQPIQPAQGRGRDNGSHPVFISVVQLGPLAQDKFIMAERSNLLQSDNNKTCDLGYLALMIFIVK